MRTILTSILMALLSAISAYANAPSDSVKVLFGVGSSQFDPSLGDNSVAFANFIDVVKRARDANVLDSIIVKGHSSPEGNSDANQTLSAARCLTIADMIQRRAGVRPSLIRKEAVGVAWDEFRRLVEGNPNVPSKEKVLYILDNIPLWIHGPGGKIVDGRKKQLMELDNGECFRWLTTHIFPQLRNAVAVSLYTRKPTFETARETAIEPDISKTDQTPDEIETVVTDMTDVADIELPTDTIGTQEPSDTIAPLIMREPRRFFMAIKTNMLYDAALVPNLGAEFYLGKNLSLYGEWMYAWWGSNPNHCYWRIYGGDLGLRWWLGRKAHKKPLTGHHVGLYGGAMTFDFEMGDTGYMGGKPGGTLWNRGIYYGGIEYGYSLAVAKRLNIDFSIGLGYMGGNYIKYFPFDNDYYLDKEYRMHFFGPTKAEISLVWLIGRGNVNKRKGGEE